MSDDNKKLTLADKIKNIALIIAAGTMVVTATKTFFNTLKNEDNANLSYRVFSVKLNDIGDRLSYIEGRLNIEHKVIVSQRVHQNRYATPMMPLMAIVPSFVANTKDATTETVAVPLTDSQHILKALGTLPDNLDQARVLLENIKGE
jgi:hypothetical protein